MAFGFQIQIGADTTGFEAGMKRAQASLQKLPQVTNQATASLTNFSRVVQDAPYGFIGIANNLNPLLESFQRLKVSTGSTGGAFKALGKELTGAGGLGLALGVASSLLVMFGDRLFGASKKAQEAESSFDKLQKATKSIFEGAAKEAAEVNGLIAVLKNEVETRERKLGAIKELQRIQPDVFKNLKLEGEAVTGLESAYKGYIDNLRLTIAAKMKQAQIEQLITKQLELQGATLTASTKRILDAAKQFGDKQIAEARAKGGPVGAGVIQVITGTRQGRQDELNKLQSDIEAALKDLTELSKGIKIDIRPDKATIDPKKIELKERVLEYPDMLQIKVKDLSVDTSGVGLSRSSFLEDFRKRNEAALAPIREQLMKMKALGDYVGGSIATAFETAFQGIAKGENIFKSLGEALKALVLDLIQAAIRAFIVKQIVNLFAPGLGSGAGGALGSLFGGIPGRASGGFVQSGQPYMVGEVGRELFIPSTSGRVVPNHQLGSIQGSAAQLIQVEVTGRLSGRDMVLQNARQSRYDRRNG